MQASIADFVQRLEAGELGALEPTSVRCPQCGAEVLEACVTPKDTPRPTHRSRLVALRVCERLRSEHDGRAVTAARAEGP